MCGAALNDQSDASVRSSLVDGFTKIAIYLYMHRAPRMDVLLSSSSYPPLSILNPKSNSSNIDDVFAFRS
jgi:hypothetical protein